MLLDITSTYNLIIEVNFLIYLGALWQYLFRLNTHRIIKLCRA